MTNALLSFMRPEAEDTQADQVVTKSMPVNQVVNKRPQLMAAKGPTQALPAEPAAFAPVDGASAGLSDRLKALASAAAAHRALLSLSDALPANTTAIAKNPQTTAETPTGGSNFNWLLNLRG
jgi:hypothetical protein